MAGVTDAPFRDIAIQCGADYGVSEMVTSQTNLWQSKKTQPRLKSHFVEKPKIIQIAGASADVIRDAAIASQALHADAIEINMGCPAKKVCNVLAGSALLQNEKLVAEILTSAVNAVEIPVYLKTRLGWDHQTKNILRIAQLAEDCGIQGLAIHGRTRSDFYNGHAEYDLIAQVKQLVKIKVFANGDIVTPEKAAEVLRLTRVDGLYIGRGALGKPWLFQQIRDYLGTGYYQEYDKEFILSYMLQHLNLIHQHYDGIAGVRFARKHIKWYLQANIAVFGVAETIFEEFAGLDNCESQVEYLTSLQSSLSLNLESNCKLNLFSAIYK